MSEIEEFRESLRKAAHHYVNLGFSIVPLGLSSKRAAIEWKELQHNKATHETVDDWFDNGVPDGNGGLDHVFNIGIITGAISGLVVLDCDNTEAEQYAALEMQRFSPLSVKTTRGRHLYFKHPGFEVRNKAGGFAKDNDWPTIAGLDLRGDGGLVVAPPSVKADDDGNIIHTYNFNVELDDVEWMLEELPVWQPWTGYACHPQKYSQEGEFDFAKVSLAGLKAQTQVGRDPWNAASAMVAKLGRKIKAGEGRNNWLTSYVGYCVSMEMLDMQTLQAAVGDFMNEFFDAPENVPAKEVEEVIRSVLSIDKRRNPQRHEQAAGYVNKTEQRVERQNALRLITSKNVAELRKLAAGSRYLIDPYIPAQSIVQVMGYNGHGKSEWLASTLWAAAGNFPHASGTTTQKIRTLYLDFELSAATLEERTGSWASSIGDMPDDFVMWARSVSDIDLNLNEAEGIEEFAKLLDEVNPHVVVIDTVRSAWVGMEEKSPTSWVKVNQFAKAVRNTGRSCIVVHHRNKPGPEGLGSAAGSTAQLTDLDLQVIVTKVCEDPAQANREAAILDTKTKVETFNGSCYTAWAYLRGALPDGAVLRAVFSISSGKVRQGNENFIETFVGIGEDINTGKKVYVSSKTPRQKALLMRTNLGFDDATIAQALRVPVPTINRWLNEGAQA